jgi:hypothetical protein
VSEGRVEVVTDLFYSTPEDARDLITRHMEKWGDPRVEQIETADGPRWRYTWDFTEGRGK